MGPTYLSIAFSAVLWVQAGCATPALWAGASSETRILLNVDGIAPATSGGAAARQLIVRYGVWAVSDRDASIPLDASGLPPAPLAYTGKSRTLWGIENDLSRAQHEAVAHHVFDPTTQADG